MGYHHYFGIKDWKSTQWKKAWRQLVKDTPRIIKLSGIPVRGEPSDETSVLSTSTRAHAPPKVDVKRGIYINGIGDDGHEPLFLVPGWNGWFVKTAGKPYDVVVACVLLRAYMLTPGKVLVSSDGDWETDWKFARDLYSIAFPGEPVRCPWGVNRHGSSDEDETEHDTDYTIGEDNMDYTDEKPVRRGWRGRLFGWFGKA